MSSKQSYLSYRDYFGSAEVSHEDQCLVGQVLYIDDLVMYEGENYEELSQAFERSVDDYLELCAQIGKAPQKTYSGTFNVRIGAELHSRAARSALRAGISLNDYVREAIKKSVDGIAQIDKDFASRLVSDGFFVFSGTTAAPEDKATKFISSISSGSSSLGVIGDKVSSAGHLAIVEPIPARKAA